MARKLLLDGGASGGSIALLLLVPLFVLMVGSRRRRNRLGADSSSRHRTANSNSGGDQQAQDFNATPGQEKSKKEKEKKEQEKRKSSAKSKIRHREIKPDAAHDKFRQQAPDNPVYQQHAMPEGYDPNNIQARPIDRPAQPATKGAHHPYEAGRILPRDQQKKGVKFVDGDNPTDNGVVRGMALHNPYNTQPTPIDVANYNHRGPETEHYKPRGQTPGARSGPRGGVRQFAHHPPWEIRQALIELTTDLKKPPVSMTAEDVDILLQAVNIVCANPSTPEQHKALEDTWNSNHGPYPMFTNPSIDILVKYLDIPLLKHFITFMDQSPSRTRWQGLVKRMGLKDPRTGEANVHGVNPRNLLWGWFFDHYRVVPADRHAMERMFADDQHSKGGAKHNLHAVEELRKIFNLLVFVEALGHACAQVRLLSSQGLDLAGLNSRVGAGPIARNSAGGVDWVLRATIFMPGGADTDRTNVANWLEKCRSFYSIWYNAKALWDTAIGSWVAGAATNEIVLRSMTFRPGWTVGAINQLFKPETSGPQNHAPQDDTPVMFPSKKGVLPGMSADQIFPFLQRPIVYVEPSLVSFSRLGQFSWSGDGAGYRVDGFRPGEIIVLLEVLGRLLQGDDMERLFGDDAEVTYNTSRDFIKRIDFGTCIPLEIEEKDNKTSKSFPSLKYFPGLTYVYLPYVSLKGNESEFNPATQANASAVLALDPSIGLWPQLGELEVAKGVKARNARLVIMIRERTDQEAWARRLAHEMKRVAKLHNIEESQWRQKVMWTEMRWDEGGAEVSADLLKDPQPLPAETDGQPTG